ncbi:MAG TPA: YbaB/EbfC family nucleoid-associated protein [Candidatus Dormibacteraeota bacterium]|jgi:hypothetical protein|nr:YbaB/EbfC family nucleoid-associated protein [Candidatus Dormibacteraeota bacterium]
MLKQVQQMQGRVAKIQEDLASETVEGSAGGGAVKAVASGSQALVSVTIDPEVVSDVEMLQDLVLTAVNDALNRSREHASRRMQELTAGLGLPPGLL